MKNVLEYNRQHTATISWITHYVKKHVKMYVKTYCLIKSCLIYVHCRLLTFLSRIVFLKVFLKCNTLQHIATKNAQRQKYNTVITIVLHDHI